MKSVGAANTDLVFGVISEEFGLLLALCTVFVLLVLTVTLLAVQNSNFLVTIYELTSAIATVVLSSGLTGILKPAGKLIVTLTMYLGRIGPITLALAFNGQNSGEDFSYAGSKVIVG